MKLLTILFLFLLFVSTIDCMQSGKPDTFKIYKSSGGRGFSQQGNEQEDEQQNIHTRDADIVASNTESGLHSIIPISQGEIASESSERQIKRLKKSKYIRIEPHIFVDGKMIYFI